MLKIVIMWELIDVRLDDIKALDNAALDRYEALIVLELSNNGVMRVEDVRLLDALLAEIRKEQHERRYNDYIASITEWES
jgi:hypothetical protein